MAVGLLQPIVVAVRQSAARGSNVEKTNASWNPIDEATARGKAVGCLLGLAVGDALGASVEFTRRGSFAPLTDMIGGGPFQLKPGQWTDDTTMALCLAESLVACDGFDPEDLMIRFRGWLEKGRIPSPEVASTSAIRPARQSNRSSPTGIRRRARPRRKLPVTDRSVAPCAGSDLRPRE